MELNREFLFYQLLHLQPEIAGKQGAVFASISKSEIEALFIAFVPLPEQQRIVGILDEAFEGIATAKANAEKNLQNARALFESHLQSVFTQRGEGWVETTTRRVCDSLHRLSMARPSLRRPTSGITCLSTAKNVQMGYLARDPQGFVAAEILRR